MKFVKILLSVIIVVALVVSAAMFFVFKNMDDLIKTAVETVGSDVTQVQVSLNRVKTDLSAGRIELHNLSIANPEGFDGHYLFDMKQVAIQVNPASVRESMSGGVIVIDEILIEAANISAEMKGTATNIQQLQKNVKASTSSNAKQTSKKLPVTSTKAESEAIDVRLMVAKFRFVDSQLQLSTDQWGNRTVNMPDIVMNNLGDRKTGLTPEQLANLVVERITKNVQKAIEKELKSAVKDEAEKQLEEELDKRLSDKDKKNLNKLKNLFGR